MYFQRLLDNNTNTRALTHTHTYTRELIETMTKGKKQNKRKTLSKCFSFLGILFHFCSAACLSFSLGLVGV